MHPEAMKQRMKKKAANTDDVVMMNEKGEIDSGGAEIIGEGYTKGKVSTPEMSDGGKRPPKLNLKKGKDQIESSSQSSAGGKVIE